MEGLRIGEVARQGGVNLQTIRYYERRGLVPKPPRSQSNYRAYPADAVRRVRFIKRSQELGFTLKEIKELLAMRAAPRAQCGDVRRRAEIKIRDIDDKIAMLRAMRKALATLVEQCASKGPVTQCPILAALDSQESA